MNSMLILKSMLSMCLQLGRNSHVPGLCLIDIKTMSSLSIIHNRSVIFYLDIDMIA